MRARGGRIMQYQQLFMSRLLQEDKSANAQSGAFGIYQNNYVETAINAMGISFPSVKAIMDEEEFRSLCYAYLKAFPKRCFDWADYGQAFSQFMLSIDELGSVPFLPELANFDWRCRQLERAAEQHFDAESFALMQTQSLDTMRFKVAPGLQIMQALFPIIEMHEVLAQPSLNQQHFQQLDSFIKTAIKTAEFRSIVMWRKEYKAELAYISGAQLNATQDLIEQRSIHNVLKHFADDEQAIASFMQQHIEAKKIVGVEEV